MEPRDLKNILLTPFGVSLPAAPQHGPGSGCRECGTDDPCEDCRSALRERAQEWMAYVRSDL
jgi:hypothetical protein